jgi:hypothetical protein
MANTQVVYNRYQGRWAPSGSISVDAPDMATAIRLMAVMKGSEPLNVSMVESGVTIAANAPSATFTTECRYDGEVGEQIGSIIPSSATLPIGNIVVLNAVPKTGFAFERYVDETGATLSLDSEYRFNLLQNCKIIANFKKDEAAPSTLTVNPTLSKLLAVNRDDGNYEKSQANQNLISLAQTFDEDISTISLTFFGDIDLLQSYASTNPAQGTHKWIGLVVDTNEDYTKTTIYYNDQALPAQEFQDANHLGIIGNGAFIVWLKADEIISASKKFTIHTSDKQKKLFINVRFQDT